MLCIFDTVAFKVFMYQCKLMDEKVMSVIYAGGFYVVTIRNKVSFEKLKPYPIKRKNNFLN